MGQSWLFPSCITYFISKNYIYNPIIEIITEIDISEIEKKFKSKPDNLAYPRRMLLRILLQAAIDSVWSSRKIDKLVQMCPSRYSSAAFSLCCMKCLGDTLHILVLIIFHSYHYTPLFVSLFNIHVSLSSLF